MPAKEVPPQLNDAKLFLIVLPLFGALYLGILWVFGAPLQTTWFTFYPDGPRLELGEFSYDRRFDIFLGPLLAYVITQLWRYFFDENTVSGFGMIFVFGGFVGTIASFIAFLLAGAPVAAVVGAAWALFTIIGLLLIVLVVKTFRKIKFLDWLYR